MNGWKKWFNWQWDETKKYVNLNDPTRRSPPTLFIIVTVLFGLFLMSAIFWK